MIKCHICNTEFEDIKYLGYHIRTHNISSKEYYDEFMKTENNGTCHCGNPTEFTGLRGYKQHCSRSCSAKEYRSKLKADPDRYNAFVEKVKNNVSNHWKNTDTKHIRSKISETLKNKNLFLSEEELKEKYGWLNKLPDNERKLKSKQIVEKSIFKWWNEASDIEKENVIKKRSDTLRKYDYSDITLWENYRKQARLETEKTYKKYKSYINPLNLKRSKSIHLDHIYSVIQGFVDDIPLEIICSPFNLRIITSKDNLSKQAKCSITLNELLEKYENISISDPDFI